MPLNDSLTRIVSAQNFRRPFRRESQREASLTPDYAEGVAALPDGVSPRFYMAVTPRYFETTGRRVVEGRAVLPQDRDGTRR